MTNKRHNIDSETKEIIRDFISEAYHLLDKAVAIISKIDSENNKEAINTIFRLFHSIKGSAGFLNFENIRKITHEAETLLDKFREKQITPNKNEIEILYQTFDLLEELINAVSENFTDKGFEEYTDLIAKKISKSIAEHEKTNNEKNKPISEPQKEINITEERNFFGINFESIDKENITQVLIMKYVEGTNQSIDNILGILPELEQNPYKNDFIIDLLRYTYHIRINSDIINYKDISNICLEIENILNSMYIGKAAINSNIIKLLQKTFSNVKISINEINITDENSNKPFIKDKDIIIQNIKQALNIRPTSGMLKPLGEILIEMGAIDNQTIEEALELQKNEPINKTEYYRDKISQLRKEDVIKVDTKKLDMLFDLIGELTIAEIMVTQNPDIIIEEQKAESFIKATENLAIITRDLQSVVLSIRMMPLESLFNRMIRLVSQLSRKAEKPIKLDVSGASTEVDRKLIEEIYDPLVHIIRNAIDHGIEKPEERQNKNKPSEGLITLSAKHEGGEIWISVSDDGVGLDNKKIIETGIKMGLITEKSTDKIPNEKLWKLIFEPGFSTASKVSEISGRGVGMDVVKKNIEKLRGQIEINSEKDKGTEVILKIPITLEIMNVMVVCVGKNKYSIPLINILETFFMEDVKVVSVNEKKESVQIRDEIIPLIKLYEVFEVKANNTNIENGIALCVVKNHKKACLFIDEIMGTQQIVIKSLPIYMNKLKSVSGFSILGNGDISLIIDIGSIVDTYID